MLSAQAQPDFEQIQSELEFPDSEFILTKSDPKCLDDTVQVEYETVDSNLYLKLNERLIFPNINKSSDTNTAECARVTETKRRKHWLHQKTMMTCPAKADSYIEEKSLELSQDTLTYKITKSSGKKTLIKATCTYKERT